jgi:hypothetical protein
LFFIFIFHLYILKIHNCVLSAIQKSRDKSLFLNKSSPEKLCLLADAMLVSTKMLRIMVSKKNCFQPWNSVLIIQYFSCHSVLNYTRLHALPWWLNTKWLCTCISWELTVFLISLMKSENKHWLKFSFMQYNLNLSSDI